MVKDPVCLMDIEPRGAAATAEHAGRLYYFCSDACREKFVMRPEIYLDKAPGMRLTVGVMGSAADRPPADGAAKAYTLGRAIAQRGFVLITGACPGYPYECARGAHDAGGLSLGISPALSLDEHVHKYHSPSDAFDVLVYTGSGLMGREVTNIRSSDMVIIVGGRSGTLGEFAIAYDEGKLIGVLEGSGGITGEIPQIIGSFGAKDTGARVVYESDPDALVHALSQIYVGHHYKKPSCFCDESTGAGG